MLTAKDGNTVQGLTAGGTDFDGQEWQHRGLDGLDNNSFPHEQPHTPPLCLELLYSVKPQGTALKNIDVIYPVGLYLTDQYG